MYGKVFELWIATTDECKGFKSHYTLNKYLSSDARINYSIYGIIIYSTTVEQNYY